MIKIIFCISSILVFNYIGASVVINRFNDNECMLDPKLVKEIASYKNVTRNIIEEITKRGLGKYMYKQFTEFVDKFGPRPAGSETLEKAIDHMLNLTINSGLTTFVTEELEVPHWVRGDESIVMIHPRKKNIALLGLGSSISTPPNGITAEAILVKSFKNLDQIDDANIKGKIVIYDVPYTSYGETVAYRSMGATKASEKGAVATLVRSVTPYSLYTPHTGAQFYGTNVTKIPTAAITHEDADFLRRIYDQGEKIILTIIMKNTFDVKKSRNTLIDVKGKVYPEKLVIVSGHIDSWDVGQGAMDDGAGMMISWLAPIALNHLGLIPKRTVRAILWTSEEPGLIGAAEYLKRHTEELKNINFIMESDEGTFKPLGLIVAGTKNARCILGEILKLFPSTNKMVTSDSPGSDITLIVKRGVPGASLLNANERYFWFHHSEADTLDVLNETDVINCAAFWAAVSFVIADLSLDIPRD